MNGIPTAVIITEEFEVPARTIARMRGIPNYPYAKVGHPIGSLNEARNSGESQVGATPGA